MSNVAIFWDYENCCPPSHSCGLGYGIVNNIGRIARLFGSVTTFRAYLDVSAQSPKSVALRSELQSSGVSMIDCPHNGKKDVVDKMILVDMLAFAVDHPTPATIILIAGDRDYAYAVSILKLRKYQVILVVPSSPHAPPCLESQASLVIDWSTAVLRSPANAAQPVRQPYADADTTLVTKLLRELQDPSIDDPDTILHASSRLRRVTARDLLEPSKQFKNADSFGSTQDLSHSPPSPGKFTVTSLPVPKTPCHSRCASVSTGSTRARGTTTVSPPAAGQYTPAKNTPLARRPSASESADAAHPSVPVLTSLDRLDVSLHDDDPPSSIIVRSPLEPTASTVEAPSMSSCHKLNCMASPFITRAPTGLQPAPHTTIQPASPTMVPNKTLTATASGTPHIRILKKVESQSKATRATDVPISGGRSDAAPHSLSSGNVGLHLTDTPPSKHASLATGSYPGVGDGDDSAQFTALGYASNTQDHASPGTVSTSSSALLSPPSTRDSHEHEPEQCPTWTLFRPLIHHLLAAHERGITRPSRSMIAVDLVKSDSQVYQRAGVSRFRDYTALAEQAGVIELGGKEGDAWIALHPHWFGVDGITTTQLASNRVPSPTFDSPNSTQHPLLTEFGSPLIGKAANSLDHDDPFQTLPAIWQGSAAGHVVSARFQPLIDTLVQMRAEGSHLPRRSLVGQSLDQFAYAQAGVSGFKEYIHQAAEAQIVELGGIGGYAWIRLHPELRL